MAGGELQRRERKHVNTGTSWLKFTPLGPPLLRDLFVLSVQFVGGTLQCFLQWGGLQLFPLSPLQGLGFVNVPCIVGWVPSVNQSVTVGSPGCGSNREYTDPAPPC